MCIESLDPPRAPRAPTHPLRHPGTDRTRPDHQITKSLDVSRFEGKSSTKSGTEIPKIIFWKYLRQWLWGVPEPVYASHGYSPALEKVFRAPREPGWSFPWNPDFRSFREHKISGRLRDGQTAISSLFLYLGMNFWCSRYLSSNNLFNFCKKILQEQRLLDR